MNKHSEVKSEKSVLVKADPNLPAFVVSGASAIAIKAGTIFNGVKFSGDTPIAPPEGGFVPGTDYYVWLKDGAPLCEKAKVSSLDQLIGGFHFAPGGNATERKGGDETPAINPYSAWDINFHPACEDPRGMTLVEMFGEKFWCDIYLLGADHNKDGTSKFGVRIADGDEPPVKIDDGVFDNLDYATAVQVMKDHGKQLLSVTEFSAAAYGVKERSSADKDPKKTKLDAPRTSKFGVMQATGNMWVWGHDGDPHEPRASLFGGSWLNGSNAGSRYAHVAYLWPGYSSDSLGARGRSDHLQLV